MKGASIADKVPAIKAELAASSKLKYLYFKCHDIGASSIAEFSGQSLPLAGSTTHHDDNAAYFTGASGATGGDVYGRDESETAAFQTVWRMDNAKGWVYGFRFYLDAVAQFGSRNYVTTFGSVSATESGGLACYFGSNGDINVEITDTSNNKVTATLDNAEYSDDTWHTFVLAVDWEGQTGQIYLDGVANGSPIDYSSLGTLTDASNDAGTQRGFTLWANGAPETAENFFADASSGGLMSDVLLAKSVTGNIFAAAEDIALDITRNPGDLPATLLEYA